VRNETSNQEEQEMSAILTRLYVRTTERNGQTMGEYALIMAAVAVVAFAAYKVLGQDIASLMTALAGDL
jgi:Flp pilus assembly pilin Flp